MYKYIVTQINESDSYKMTIMRGWFDAEYSDEPIYEAYAEADHEHIYDILDALRMKEQHEPSE